MKKITMPFLVLSSVSFANKDLNVYGKFGVDFYSRYTKTSDIDSEGMESKLGFSEKGKLNRVIFLEGTKNITPNFELGVGLGYINRKNGSSVTALSGIETSQIGSVVKKSFTYDYYKSVAYDSIPLYVTGKYNFKPYIKVEQIEYENSQVHR